jgi:DNA repair protein RecN (Recombination protein N)
MLNFLKIQNLILIEQAEISFRQGLNVLTGETGSGKSVILSAIRLLSGTKGDLSLIRKETDVAIVEGHFIHDSQAIILRREIDRSGKNRCFLMDRQISLQELKKQALGFFQIVDQGTCYTLGSLDLQREFLDLFANLPETLKEFRTLFEKEKELKETLRSLESMNFDKESKIAHIQDDLDLIAQTKWSEEEEKSLIEKQTKHLNKATLTQKVEAALQGFSTGTSQVRRIWLLIEEASRIDPALQSVAQQMKSAFLELQEGEVGVRSYAEDLESSPQELVMIEERLSAIDRLKRRFGKTLEEILMKEKDLTNELEKLQSIDSQIAHASSELTKISSITQEMAARISDHRNKAKKSFQEQILKELKSLNLPFASFEIEQSIQPMTATGIDQISFLFSANPGYPPTFLADCASGGELSRLLLSLKIVLSKVHPTGCFIFDEIDANVGGHSALVLGEKLKMLATDSQVICITHFSQVALAADHHFVVSKQEKNGKTITKIQLLEPDEKELEYGRMMGKISPIAVL